MPNIATGKVAFWEYFQSAVRWGLTPSPLSLNNWSFCGSFRPPGCSAAPWAHRGQWSGTPERSELTDKPSSISSCAILAFRQSTRPLFIFSVPGPTMAAIRKWTKFIFYFPNVRSIYASIHDIIIIIFRHNLPKRDVTVVCRNGLTHLFICDDSRVLFFKLFYLFSANFPNSNCCTFSSQNCFFLLGVKITSVTLRWCSGLCLFLFFPQQFHFRFEYISKFPTQRLKM